MRSTALSVAKHQSMLENGKSVTENRESQRALYFCRIWRSIVLSFVKAFRLKSDKERFRSVVADGFSCAVP